MVLENEFGEYEPKHSEAEHHEMEADLPPEYCHYRDEGCEVATACLNCPFQQCIYERGGRQRWVKKLRDKEIMRLFTREGSGVKELALMFGLSQRTIQRALKNSLSKSTSQKQVVTSDKGELNE